MFRNQEYNTRLYFRGSEARGDSSAAGLGRGLEWVLGTGVGYLPWVADLARAWLSSPHRATTSVLHRVLFGGILDTAVVRHGLGERNNQGELCNRPLLELSLLGSHFW